MPKKPPVLLQSHSSAVEYGAVVLLVRERIEVWLAEYEHVKLREVDILGSVTALRVLSEAYPILVSPLLAPDDIDDWSRAFSAWVANKNSPAKSRRAALNVAIVAEILSELAKVKLALQ